MAVDEKPETVGIKDVARIAGVAVSSVSRVLTGHPDVSDRMRETVRRAVVESGYEPDMVAQSLRSGRTMSIGFVVGDITNPLMSEIGLAAEMRLSDDGYSVLLANSKSRPRGDAQNISEFRRRKVDGLLLSLTNETADDVRALLLDWETPAVLLDRDLDDVPVARVLFDHESGFTAATRHLLDLGHERIAVLAGPSSIRPTRVRVEAVTQTMRSSGKGEPTVLLGSFSARHGHRSTLELLKGDERPTALILGGNQLLPGALRALNELSLSVPGDVSLVTADGGDLAALHTPTISSVQRDFAEMGQVAAEVLLDMMRGGSPRTVTLPTTFRPRDSTGAPPASV